MKALVTGASSGIGLEMAKYLAEKKYELIMVARSKEKLESIQKMLATKTTIVVLDVSNEQKIKELCVLIKNEHIDLLINCAGFGDFGFFTDTDLATDINMIDTNLKAVHILTKYCLKEMEKNNYGYILNVASSAGFMPGGPLMSTYYATKAYVYSLTQAINYELKEKKSKVVVSVLCPGPVDTNFNNVAGVSFSIKPLSARYVARYSIDQLFQKKKMLIIPGSKLKLVKFFMRFSSNKFLLRQTYKIQNKKRKKRS